MSFIYLAVTLIPVLGLYPYGPLLFWFDVVMSVIFAVDYVIRLLLAPDRRAFARHIWNLADVVVILTPLLVLRFQKHWTGLIRLFRLLRLIWIGGRLWGRERRSSVKGQVKWMLLVAACTVSTAGVLVWLAERDEPASDTKIATLWDAIWWSMVTMSTVGYGDRIPVSTTGKAAAIVLMIGGVALFGWVTAILASSFLESGAEKEAKRQRNEMERKLSYLAWQLRHVQGQQSQLAGEEQAQAKARTPRLAVMERVWPPEVYEAHQRTSSSTTVSEEEVGIDWTYFFLWRWASASRRRVRSFWACQSCKEGFWYAFALVLYIAACLQASQSTDEFWRAAGITIPLFAWSLLLRRCWHWAGWLQFALLLALALLLGAGVSLILSSPLLVAGVALAPWEARATHAASVARLKATVARRRDGGGRQFGRLGAGTAA